MSVPSIRLSGGLLTLLGSALAAFLVLDAAASPDPVYWVVEAYPILLALTLAGAGVLIARGHLVADRYRGRLLAWTVAGVLVFSLLAAYLYSLQVVFAGHGLRDTPVGLITIPTLGALGGLLVGVYDARNRERGAAIERLSQANNTLRIATGEAVERATRGSLERAVCERLAESDAYDAAWVHRTGDDPLTFAAAAGPENASDDAFTDANEDAYETAVRTRTVQFLPDEDRDDTEGGTLLDPADAGTAVVPLVGAERVHGTLTLAAARPHAFHHVRDVLAELGETLGRAVDSHDARDALSRREAELVAHNERLEKFASVVSHDLRNPLAVILGRAELLADPGENEHRDAITNAGERMEAIITDLLALSRAGRTVDDPEPVGVAATARAAWATVRTHDQTLDLSVPDTETVQASRSRLRTLFENLFRNSLEHGATGAEDAGLTVRVGVTPDGFFVEDDGRGIPASRRDDIFDHGYTTNAGGTGFGLSIVAEIVDAHDWTIAVTEGDDGGARFEIGAPVRERENAT